MAGALVAGFILAADPSPPPRDLGLTEKASSRLAQIDVTVEGAKDAIEGLTAGDFEVRLNDKIVPKLFVDDLCVAAQPPPPAHKAKGAPEAEPATPASAAPKSVPATFLFYFDMVHLTQSGRQGAIAAARDVVPKLMTGGNRAMLVASAAELKTIVPLTADAAALEKALDALVNDGSTFDVYTATEDNRLHEVVLEMDRGVDFAMMLARRYAAEERWRQEQELRRLSMVLGRLTDVDPPKAVLYFADSMRQNAGEHYLSFFNDTRTKDANGKPMADADAILTDAATGALPLDRVINEAAGLGIRFYTVEGEGIAGGSSMSQSRNNGTIAGNAPSTQLNSQRIRDSQGTMTSIAAETGGRAFLNGVSPSRMAGQILGDLSCMYLLSFDPAGFAQDKPLTVSVKVTDRKVKTTVRGRLVIQSDATRLTGRLLSAFATASTQPDAASSSLKVGVVPIAYDGGSFKARVQVSLGGSKVPTTVWDVGASVVSKGVVWQDGSGRIQLTTPETPVVFEKDMTFAPGDYDLVAVAHETQTDTVLSKEVHGTWPKIDAEPVTLAPIAVSQPRAGGFLKNGQSQTQGAVVIGDGDLLRPEEPTAVIALVCRAKDQKRPLSVARTLVGETETPVGTTVIEMAGDRCAQVLDLIPPKTLGPGRYRFVIAVTSDGQQLARAERPLVVPEPEAAPAPAAGASGS